MMPASQKAPSLGNIFLDELGFRLTLKRHLGEEVYAECAPQLAKMGELSSTNLHIIDTSHRTDLPRHIPFDAWGHRVDRIEVNAAWQHFAQVATRWGLVSLPYDKPYGCLSRIFQMGLVYQFSPSSQFYTCPLAMTDGSVRTLKQLASAELNETVVPHLINSNPDMAWISGQWMTEKGGGSDVAQSVTIARPDKQGHRLYGHKWFCSAINSDIALTLARPEDSPSQNQNLALFLVKLRNAEGQLQDFEILRLKDKLGTRHLPTAEIKLCGTPATAVSGLDQGIKNMRFMLNITRTWNAVCALATMGRCLAWVRSYAPIRQAFGRPLAQHPLYLQNMAKMTATHLATMQLVFHNVAQLGLQENADLSSTHSQHLRVTTALAKILSGKAAVAVASETLESFGGAGYVEDTGLPQLLRDAQVFPIWEGTTDVLAQEACRAIGRHQILHSLVDRFSEMAAQSLKGDLAQPAQRAIQGLKQVSRAWPLGNQPDATPVSRHLVLHLARCIALALLVDHARWAMQHHSNTTAVWAAQLYASREIPLELFDFDKFSARDLRHLAFDPSETVEATKHKS
jgi:acyl-CoA dehydrogenase